MIIPGSMGTASWVLAGQPGSMEQSFGTTCHGAGRMMSRTAAVKLAAGRRIDKELDALGIIARARGHKGLAEEQPAAYKDVDQVVEVVDKAGISQEGRPAPAGGGHQGLIGVAGAFRISLRKLVIRCSTPCISNDPTPLPCGRGVGGEGFFTVRAGQDPLTLTLSRKGRGDQKSFVGCVKRTKPLPL